MEFLTSWLRAHTGEKVTVFTTSRKVVGFIRAVDDYGNVQLEVDDFSDTTLIQRRGITMVEPFSEAKK